MKLINVLYGNLYRCRVTWCHTRVLLFLSLHNYSNFEAGTIFCVLINLIFVYVLALEYFLIYIIFYTISLF